jgi:hypothetical protein
LDDRFLCFFLCFFSSLSSVFNCETAGGTAKFGSFDTSPTNQSI